MSWSWRKGIPHNNLLTHAHMHICSYQLLIRLLTNCWCVKHMHMCVTFTRRVMTRCVKCHCSVSDRISSTCTFKATTSLVSVKSCQNQPVCFSAVFHTSTMQCFIQKTKNEGKTANTKNIIKNLWSFSHQKDIQSFLSDCIYTVCCSSVINLYNIFIDKITNNKQPFYSVIFL